MALVTLELHNFNDLNKQARQNELTSLDHLVHDMYHSKIHQRLISASSIDGKLSQHTASKECHTISYMKPHHADTVGHCRNNPKWMVWLMCNYICENTNDYRTYSIYCIDTTYSSRHTLHRAVLCGHDFLMRVMMTTKGHDWWLAMTRSWLYCQICT